MIATASPRIAIVALLVLVACESTPRTAERPAIPGPAAAPEPGAAPAPVPAWDQRLLDLLAVQMELTERLTTAVATQTDDPDLRAYAEAERQAARSWRDEIGAFRGRWYPGVPPVSSLDAPTLAELGAAAADAAAPLTRDDDAAFLADVIRRVDQLETEPFDRRTVVETLAPMHQRAISAANLGTTQATHPELRDLSARMVVAEQHALDQLLRLGAREKG